VIQIDVLESIKALALSEGLSLYQTDSGSLYIRNRRGEQWRVSNHEFPDRPTGNPWKNRQIILRDTHTPRSVIDIVVRGSIDWFADSL